MSLNSRFKSHWSQLDQKQRLWLSFGGLIVFGLLYWALFWDPIDTKRHSLRQQIGSLHADIIWLERLETQSAATPGRALDKSLLRLVDETLRQQQMAASIDRIDPESDGGISVSLSNVSFDRYIAWLDQLSSAYGVNVVRMNIQRHEGATGVVNVRLQLSEPNGHVVQ